MASKEAEDDNGVYVHWPRHQAVEEGGVRASVQGADNFDRIRVVQSVRYIVVEVWRDCGGGSLQDNGDFKSECDSAMGDEARKVAGYVSEARATVLRDMEAVIEGFDMAHANLERDIAVMQAKIIDVIEQKQRETFEKIAVLEKAVRGPESSDLVAGAGHNEGIQCSEGYP